MEERSHKNAINKIDNWRLHRVWPVPLIACRCQWFYSFCQLNRSFVLQFSDFIVCMLLLLLLLSHLCPCYAYSMSLFVCVCIFLAKVNLHRMPWHNVHYIKINTYTHTQTKTYKIFLRNKNAECRFCKFSMNIFAWRLLIFRRMNAAYWSIICWKLSSF